MENIYEPNTSFPFSQLHFISPTAVAGGNYFIRCLTGKQTPLYIQPPKCHSKNGIVKTGKRMYIDLVFHHEDEAFIEWMEKMENLCQTKIYDNREKWFESGLEMHDIENSFTPAMKIYKSGKMYVIRANIPVRLGKCGLKIYDEQENDVDPESIADTTPLMTILEIQGVKCSSRSFQLELEVKQMMKLSPSNLFESCVFSKVKKSDSPVPQSTETDTDSKTSDMQMVLVEDVKLDEGVEDVKDVESENHVDTKNLEKVEVKLEAEPTIPVLGDKNQDQDPDQDLEPVEVNLDSDLVGTTSTSNKIIMDADEIDFPLDESSTEVVKLKHKDDVYFEMYKNAKRKAKIARDIALSAYLEAKQIKNTYLIHGQEEEDEENEDDEETELRNMEKSIEESMEDKKIL